MDAELKAKLDRLENGIKNTQDLLTLALLSSGPNIPVTSVASVFSGDLIGVTDNYLELYKNNYNRLIALTVSGDFAIPGSTVSLSLSNNPSNYDRIDVLSSVGKVISNTIWLRPFATLYINTADTAFTCAGSVFKVRLFDPLSFLALREF